MPKKNKSNYEQNKKPKRKLQAEGEKSNWRREGIRRFIIRIN